MILKQLRIKNFLLIEASEMNLDAGFTVITGESGAGKSLVFKAIRFCLGAKLSKTYIGSFGQSLQVELVFVKQNEQIKIRHELSRERRRAWVNGERISQEALKVLAQGLVLDCQQNFQLQLLDESYQLSWIDGQIKDGVLRDYQEAQDAYRAIQFKLEQSEQYIHEDTERLVHCLAELACLDELLDFQQLSDHLSRVKVACQLVDQWQQQKRELYQQKKGLQTFSNQLDNDAVTSAVATSLESIEVVEATIDDYFSEALESRHEVETWQAMYSQYKDLSRKYKVRPEALRAFFQEQQMRYDQIIFAKSEHAALTQACLAAKQDYEEKGKIRDQHRLIISQQLSQWVSPMLALLGMNDAVFEARYVDQKVTFLMKTNPGMSFKPIKSCLSGGELSRLSLLLFSFCGDERPWLLDEIDTGISGETTHLVRQMLMKMSQGRQILAISHLATVAIGAKQHFLIEKHKKHQQMMSQVRLLDHQETKEELLRLLCGSPSNQDLLKPLYDRMKHEQGEVTH